MAIEQTKEELVAAMLDDPESWAEIHIGLYAQVAKLERMLAYLTEGHGLPKVEKDHVH